MAQSVIQHAFHAGEWAPALNARVDLQKYRSACALASNFFVDYRGGLSTRFGTKYVLQAYKSDTAVRLIKFQASSDVGYILEFGNLYVRFHFNGAPVLESTTTILGISQANPASVNVTSHGYSVGDWVFITGVAGMTQVNNRYFIVNTVPDANHFTLKDLYGAAVDSTSYGAWTSGGTAARVYTLATPFVDTDLATLKFAQNVSYMVLCHPNYAPQILTLVSANHWTLAAMTIGSTVAAPTIASVTITGGTGSTNYGYIATAVDIYGQESGPSSVFQKSGADISSTTKGSNAIALSATISGAEFYNFYKSQLNYAAAVPSGVEYGFIGYSTTVNFIDNNIAPDFSQTPPILDNPFIGGSGVIGITITASGAPMSAVPSLTLAAPSSGSTATATASLGITAVSIVSNGNFFALNEYMAGVPNGAQIRVTAVGGGGIVNAVTIDNPGSITGVGTTIPTNPQSYIGALHGVNFQCNLTWGVLSAQITYAGSGYTSAPAVSFSGGTGTPTATSTISSSATPAGNPSVPAFFNQRLVLAAPTGAPQTFYCSQPGFPFNFNISNPTQADDAITQTIVSPVLNTIKSMVPMSKGLIMLGDSSAFVVNGGTEGTPVSAINISATPQSYAGASDVPPIVANFDILYVQQKGSIIRDLTYNYYLNNYVGADITILSSHLFFGYVISEWAFAEEPWKVVWCVRNDGIALALTYVKEQEIVGWTHSTTDGNFKSVAAVTEAITLSNSNAAKVDAVYFVVERSVNGQTLKYIERMADRFMPSGVSDAWCVDCGLHYSGPPASTLTGLDHLIGESVVGIADGVAFGPTVVSADGSITLAGPCVAATVGLAYTPQFQTLRLETGEPTQQGKRKKIAGVTVRVAETLGLSIGRAGAGGAFSTNLVPMKDLVVGNVGTMTNTAVSGLVTDDARTIIDPLWDPYGEVCIQQSNPYPATILGVIPEIILGDT